MNLVSTSNFSNYWERVPLSLRLIIKARIWTAIGAGGVLYLTPIIFNSIGLSVSQIGSGITTAAFAGITTRLGSGYLLDKGYSYKKSIQVASLIAIVSDFILFNSQNFPAYISGQFLLGAAAGIYWPSVELGVPLNCNNQIKPSEGYTLARSADAIGVTLGVLIGTIGTYFEFTRIIYFIDTICMLNIIIMLINKHNIFKNNQQIDDKNDIKYSSRNNKKILNIKWIVDLIPLLLVTLFVTGFMSLLQSILPLDLVNGGIIRPAIIEHKVASLVTFKLVLLSIFQWPFGYIIREKNSSFKFSLCLILILIGFLIIALSNFLLNGYLLIIIAFIPLTIALCIFLPSASDAIIKSTPSKYHGSAIALYSQCFGISALTMPWLSGKLIDNYDTAFQVWLIVSFISILLMPICKRIK